MINNSQVLFDEIQDKLRITVEQHSNLRTLHFNNSFIQTQIDLNHPDRLPIKANQMMLSHLMFGYDPEKILLAGCGGGAIARWFHAQRPSAQGIAIDNNETVLKLAKQYFEFPQTNWQLINTDMRDYLQHTTQQFDFILFDFEENETTPHWLVSEHFLHQVRNCLTDKGAATFNIVVEKKSDLVKALTPMRQVFNNMTYCLSSQGYHNVMITGFKNYLPVKDLKVTARYATATFGINFMAQLKQLLKENPLGSGAI